MAGEAGMILVLQTSISKRPKDECAPQRVQNMLSPQLLAAQAAIDAAKSPVFSQKILSTGLWITESCLLGKSGRDYHFKVNGGCSHARIGRRER
jgi:hypothetical protein